MAFTSIPRDLSLVKTKFAIGLSKRQLICFSTAAAIGVPVYIFTRGIIGNSAAVLAMIGLMLPLFFLAMYEKDGQPAEIILRNYVRARIFWPGKRPYKTENFYEILQNSNVTLQPIAPTGAGRRRDNIAIQTKTTAKASVGKRKAGKSKSRLR